MTKESSISNFQYAPVDDGCGDGELVFWGVEENGPMVLREEAGDGQPRYDLVERTAVFGEQVILFAKKMPDNAVNHRIIGQLVGAATSVGANYCEADEAVSKKDFCHKISICRKEAKETKHFLRMAATAEPNLKEIARPLWQEARELHLIFAVSIENKIGNWSLVIPWNLALGHWKLKSP